MREIYLKCLGLKVPVLSIVIGEGGSGGALAVAVADEVWMLENSVYSILHRKDLLLFYGKTARRRRRLRRSCALQQKI